VNYGKPFGDYCKINDECISKICMNGICEDQEYGSLKRRTKSKEEVLKLDLCHDGHCDYPNFYCKDDICVEYYYENKIIEFQNKEGKKESYIVELCTSADIESGKCFGKKCTLDSQCISNKCTNHYCTVNEDTPVVYCEAAYRYNYIIGDNYEVMHCGKPYNYKCKNGDECSSENCVSGVCADRKSHEGANFTNSFYRIFIIIFVCLFSCCTCCCLCVKKNKTKNATMKEISEIQV
jgi:hypothetical protein